MNIEFITSLPLRFGCRCRINTVDTGLSDWDTVAIVPVPSYIELPIHEPVRVADILWFEIDPVEIEHVGCLVPDKRIDHTEAVLRELEAQSLNYETVDGNLRITMQ